MIGVLFIASYLTVSLPPDLLGERHTPEPRKKIIVEGGLSRETGG